MTPPRPLLRLPLRALLRRPFDELATQRAWSRLRTARTPPVRHRRAAVLLAAALAVAALLLIVLRRDVGPLRLDADRVVLEVDLSGPPLQVQASDGSAITVSPGGRVEVVESSATAFGTHVDRGRARFEVRPGSARRWTVDCGAFVVEVVGTAFEVERTADQASVSVDRGEVVVRGEAVPGHLVRLRAGERLTVPLSAVVAAPSAAVSAAPAPPAGPDAPAPSPDASGPELLPQLAPQLPSPLGPQLGPYPGPPAPALPTSSASTSAASPWRDLARAGDYRQAYAVLGPEGLRDAALHASVDELLTLADVARLSGHPADAVAPLERILREQGGAGRASIAALTLGRLQLDSLGQPAAAAASLNRAIAAGLPGGLAEDALARRVEAYARAGDRDAARAALAELERRYPASGRVAPARRWVDPPP